MNNTFTVGFVRLLSSFCSPCFAEAVAFFAATVSFATLVLILTAEKKNERTKKIKVKGTYRRNFKRSKSKDPPIPHLQVLE